MDLKKQCTLIQNENMQNDQYQILNIVKTLNEAKIILEEHNVSKHRTSNLSNSTKFSNRCGNSRKYPLCKFEIQVVIEDTPSTTIKLMYKNSRCHQHRNPTTRESSPVREMVSKFVDCNLTQNQIKNLLTIDPSELSCKQDLGQDLGYRNVSRS